MKGNAYWALAAMIAFAALDMTAVAEDDDIYVAPLDEDGSDETLSEEASSGFDAAGSFYIDEDDYYSGTSGDGTWDPDIPEVSPPEFVDEGDE